MNGAKLIEKWPELRKLTEKQILDGTTRCAGEEREALLKFLLYLSEVERRRSYECAGVNKRSLWEFLEESLAFTKAETRLRYHSAKLLLRFPIVAEYLGDGRLNMTTLVVMKDILTRENVRTECDKAVNKSKAEVESQVAERNPTVLDFATFTKGPAATITEVSAAPTVTATSDSQTESAVSPDASSPDGWPQPPPSASAAASVPDAPGSSFLVKNAPSKSSVKAFTATQDILSMTLRKNERAELDELCELLSQVIPDKDPRKVILHSIRKLRTELLKKRGKIPVKARAPKKEVLTASTAAVAPSIEDTLPTPSAAAVPAPVATAGTTITHSTTPGATKPKSYALKPVTIPDAAVDGRHRDRTFTRESIPEATARFVWIRDNSCCQYRLKGGAICGSTYRCEIDHKRAVADGGSNHADNLQITCRKHNQDRARRRFGEAHIDQAIQRRRDAKRGTRAPGPTTAAASSSEESRLASGATQPTLFRDRPKKRSAEATKGT